MNISILAEIFFGIVILIGLGFCLLFLTPALGELVGEFSDPTYKFIVYLIPVGLVVIIVLGVLGKFRREESYV